MKIGIIGAGFTGLAAAYQLSKNGHSVTVFEKDPHPGGLAVGYKEKSWQWSLEKHYHHWFTNDLSVLQLAQEIEYTVLTKRPKTSVYVEESIAQLDSPMHLLSFSKLSTIDRLRMAAVLGFLRYNPLWQPLEKVPADSFLSFMMGEKGYEMIWLPQLKNKFGDYYKEISLAWFWARIKKRTSSLAYPEGGFLHFAQKLVGEITKYGGKVLFETQIVEVIDNKNVMVKLKDKKGNVDKHIFEALIVTLPSVFFINIAPQLPNEYKNKLGKLKGLGAMNLILRLKKPFFADGTYWLSVCDTSSPIMAIVEHTNFMDKKHYNNEHIVYLGKYLSADDPLFAKNKEEVLKIYDPFLQKIHPDYQKDLIGYELFKAPFAQPIIPVNYSSMIPSMITPLPHVFLANIEQVYPWDRGTNYAVELGEKVANIVNGVRE